MTFLEVGSFNSKQPTGNAFEAVNQARHRAFRWIVDEQVYVLGCAVHFDQLRLEIGTNFFKHDFEPLESPPNTLLRYFVTKTKWTCNAKTQCLP